MHPFKNFQLNNAIFAAIWLVFLAAILVQVYVGAGYSTGDKAWMTACVAVFSAFYFWAFGSMESYPSGWSQFARAILRWAVLLVIALASVPVIKTGVISYAPYLAAILGFSVPWRKSLPIVAATGVVGTLAVWLVAPEDLGWSSLPLFAMPFLLVAVGVFSQYDVSRYQLQHELDLAQQREDIATDVHDLLGHSLTVINLKSEVARRALRNNAEQAERELKEISELSRLALAEVRATVTRMRTPTFAGEVQGARRALETKGIAAHLPERLTPAGVHETVFSWCLRELTTNVVRHSGARTCWVSMTADKLQVTDDGCGFSADATGSADAPANDIGGLAGLRERVEAAGGRLTVSRERGLTRVLVSMGGDNVLLKDGAVAGSTGSEESVR